MIPEAAQLAIMIKMFRMIPTTGHLLIQHYDHHYHNLFTEYLLVERDDEERGNDEELHVIGQIPQPAHALEGSKHIMNYLNYYRNIVPELQAGRGC